MRSGKSPILMDSDWGEVAKPSIIKEMKISHLIFDLQILDKPDHWQFSLELNLDSDFEQFPLELGKNTNAGCFYRISGLGNLGIHVLLPITFGESTTILPQHSYFDTANF
jgi:hypothetical protein